MKINLINKGLQDSIQLGDKTIYCTYFSYLEGEKQIKYGDLDGNDHIINIKNNDIVYKNGTNSQETYKDYRKRKALEKSHNKAKNKRLQVEKEKKTV